MATRDSKGATVAAKIIADRQQASAPPLSAADDQPQTNRPPVARVNFGGVQASIWANASDKGDFHTVTFARRYQEGGEWKTSNSYSASDLLALQKVADLAVNRIIELQQGRGRAA